MNVLNGCRRRTIAIVAALWLGGATQAGAQELGRSANDVNPLGIQAVGRWLEGTRNDGGRPPVGFNPGFIGDSRGEVVEDGWVAEIRVPFTALQFAEGGGRRGASPSPAKRRSLP